MNAGQPRATINAARLSLLPGPMEAAVMMDRGAAASCQSRERLGGFRRLGTVTPFTGEKHQPTGKQGTKSRPGRYRPEVPGAMFPATGRTPTPVTNRKLKSRVNFRVSDWLPGVKPGQKELLVRVVLRGLEKTLTNETGNALRDRIYRALHQATEYQWAANDPSPNEKP